MAASGHLKGRSLAALAATVVLAGCAAPQGAANADRTYSPANRATGLLAASLTVSGEVPGSVWVQLSRSGDTSQPLSIPVNVAAFGLDWNPGTDGTGRRFHGRLAALELSPGTYEFGRWVMNVSNRALYISGQRVGGQVLVKAGEAVYAGNLHIDIQASTSSVQPGRVEFSDEAKRDLPLLEGKYPGLKAGSVRTAVAAREEAARDVRPRVRPEDLDGLLRAK